MHFTSTFVALATLSTIATAVPATFSTIGTAGPANTTTIGNGAPYKNGTHPLRKREEYLMDNCEYLRNKALIASTLDFAWVSVTGCSYIAFRNSRLA
jgi:hypothetical protein